MAPVKTPNRIRSASFSAETRPFLPNQATSSPESNHFQQPFNILQSPVSKRQNSNRSTNAPQNRTGVSPFMLCLRSLKFEESNGNPVFKSFEYHRKVLFAIMGCLLFWLGAWNLEQYDCALSSDIVGCAQGPNASYVGHHHRKELLDDSLYRGFITAGVGWCSVVVSNTLYLSASLEGEFYTGCSLYPARTWEYMLLGVRVILGMAGTTALYSGMYVMMQNGAPGQKLTFCPNKKDDVDPDYCEPDMIVHVAIFGLGILTLVASGTFNGATFIPLPTTDEPVLPNCLQRICGMHDADDPDSFTICDHVRYTIRSTLSVFGQTALWFSSQRIVDYSVPKENDSPYRVLFFALFGLCLLCATDSVFENSFLDPNEEEEDDDDDDENADTMSIVANWLARRRLEPKGKVAKPFSAWLFYINSFVSLVGQLLFQNMFWEFIDVYGSRTAVLGNTAGTWLQYRTTELNIYLMVIGIALMLMSGSLLINASIYLYPRDDADDDDGSTGSPNEEALVHTNYKSNSKLRSPIYEGDSNDEDTGRPLNSFA